MERYYGQPYNKLDDPLASTSSIGLSRYAATADNEPVVDDHYTRPLSQHHEDSSYRSQPRAYEPYRQQPDAYGPTSGGYGGYGPPPHTAQPSSGWAAGMMQRTKSWSPRKRLVVFGSTAAGILLVIILIAVGIAAAVNHDSFSYTPSTAQVNNTEAFYTGGATHTDPTNTTDGIGTGQDVYKYYTGDSSNFPNYTTWISFEDMWNNNLHTLENSCGILGYGSNNSPQINSDIYDAIQNRANASLVDHRYIFAVILQESKGCVHIKTTVSSSGVKNPGIMQSHDGSSYSSSHSNESILAMVQDGTQGTSDGDGLVQNLNLYGNPYKAARAYNSGYIPKSGNLSEASGATACYVSDIANRLTGWVNATSTCPGDNST